MSKQAVKDYLGKYKELIDREIEAELVRRLEEVRDISPHLVPVIEAMQELSVGGKRLRGLLTILGYELAQAKRSTRSLLVGGELIRAAAMMEIFHLGLLIQDDWMDRDELRRGVRTMHTRYEDLHTGNFVAMLSGDLTFGWGMEILASDQLSVISDQDRIKAIGVWGKYFTRVGYGQTLDGLAIADEETLLQILSLKSGEYTCVLPLQFGASLGDGPLRLMERLNKYGMELGWVFQLRDDWLAEYGESEKTGKPVGNDSREGKRTYATLYGKERLELEIQEHFQKGMRLCDLRGPTSQAGVMDGLLEWMATREN